VISWNDCVPRLECGPVLLLYFLKFPVYVRGALSILGCDPFDDNWVGEQSNDLTEIVDGLVKLALAEREEARIRQDWQSADRIRDAISAVGISIEDTSSGPRWTITRGEDR
jgi:cysteinyl-tRNA synthetase